MNYLKKIIRTGAVRKTPPRIIDRICREVNAGKGKTIIEVGAGQGEITNILVKNNEFESYTAFEIDPDFYLQLKQRFPNIRIEKSDALQFRRLKGLQQTVDYFISSIPLSFYKTSDIETFCSDMLLTLNPKGKIIILFTAFWLIPTLKHSLPGLRMDWFITLPPYFLAIFENKGNTN
jgi:phospholipid N-methyltransferase